MKKSSATRQPAPRRKPMKNKNRNAAQTQHNQIEAWKARGGSKKVRFNGSAAAPAPGLMWRH